jgi:hypothetical protein
MFKKKPNNHLLGFFCFINLSLVQSSLWITFIIVLPIILNNDRNNKKY